MAYDPPVPNSSISVLQQSAANIDEFATGLNDTYTDRGGVQHKTVEGVIKGAEQDIINTTAGLISEANAKIEAAIINAGYIVEGTFSSGATLNNANEIIQWTTGGGGSGEYYRWGGSLPKVVPAASTPASTGGFGNEAWILAVSEEGVTPKVINLDTLTAAQSETSLVLGDSVLVKERETGQSGGGKWDAVDSGLFPANGFDVVSSSVPGVNLKLEKKGRVYLEQLGAVGDNVTDDSAALKYAWSNCPFLTAEPNSNFYITEQLSAGRFLNFLGVNVTIHVRDTFVTPGGDWIPLDSQGKFSIVTTDNGQRSFDSNTASALYVEGLNFQVDNNFGTVVPLTGIPYYVYRLNNMIDGYIKNCSIKTSSSLAPGSRRPCTPILLDSCIRKFTVESNELANETQKQLDAGGCFWISSVNGYSPEPNNWVRDIRVINNNMFQDAHDDAIALFCRQGIIDGVVFDGNTITSQGETQDVLISVHSVLDFSPAARADSTAYVVDDFINIGPNGFFYKCVTSGTSAASLPSDYENPEIGELITDGTAVFETTSIGAKNVTFTNNKVNDNTSTNFTCRVGRDIPDDVYGITENVHFEESNEIICNKTGGIGAIYVHKEATRNVTVEDAVIRNFGSSITFAIRSATKAQSNTIYGAFEMAVAEGDLANDNEVVFDDGVNPKENIQAAVMKDNRYRNVSDTSESFALSQTSSVSLKSLYSSTEAFGLNLIGNSNNFTGSGWSGSGGFTSITADFANGVFQRSEATRLLNNTGSNQSLIHTTGNQPDGTYTAYIAIKGNGTNGFVQLAIYSIADVNNRTDVRHYFRDDRYTVIPVTYNKSTGGSDQIGFSLTAFTNTDILICHAANSEGGPASYVWTSGNNAAPKSTTVYVGSIPASGSWKRGDFAYNVFPTVLGAASSQYVVIGWKRITTGSGNVLNTDWVEMRTLTGT